MYLSLTEQVILQSFEAHFLHNFPEFKILARKYSNYISFKSSTCLKLQSHVLVGMWYIGGLVSYPPLAVSGGITKLNNANKRDDWHN